MVHIEYNIPYVFCNTLHTVYVVLFAAVFNHWQKFCMAYYETPTSNTT